MVVRAAQMEAALETQNGGPRVLQAEAVGGKEPGLFPEEQEDWLEGGHGAGAGVASACPTDLTLCLNDLGRVRIKT